MKNEKCKEVWSEKYKAILNLVSVQQTRLDPRQPRQKTLLHLGMTLLRQRSRANQPAAVQTSGRWTSAWPSCQILRCGSCRKT